jgi:hypothetical protein
MLFDDEDEEDETPITEEEKDNLLQLMADINAQHQEQQENKSTAD